MATYQSLFFITGTIAPEGNVSAQPNQFYFQMDTTNNIYAFWVKTGGANGQPTSTGWKKIG